MVLIALVLACAPADTKASPIALDDTGETLNDTAASNDLGETGTFSEAMTPEAFIASVVPVNCALQEECGALDDVEMTYDECLVWLAEQTALAMAECTTFDPVAASACVDAQETATCADISEGDGSHFAACYAICV